MTKEITIFIVLSVGLLAVLIFWRRSEARRMKQKTLEAMSETLRDEIQNEREQNREKKEKFEEALRKAGES